MTLLAPSNLQQQTSKQKQKFPSIRCSANADGWDGVLKPVVARYKKKVSRIYFRADAGPAWM